MSRFRRTFCIAGIRIAVDSELAFDVTERYHPFQAEFDTPDVTLHLRPAPAPRLDGYQLVSRFPDCDILRREGTVARLQFTSEAKKTAAWCFLYADADPANCTVLFFDGWEPHLQALNPFFFFDLTRLLMDHSAAVLHSSLVSCGGKGLVFTAPSRTGKSTQADLWAKYKGAEVLNGDRSILRKEPDGYYAYGSPYAGSSGIYKNKRAPLTAIVVLRQSRENRIRPLGLKEACLCLLSQLSVSRWDRSLVERQTDWLLDLLGTVPVYRLDCLPDRGAVELLSNTLGGI